MNVAVVYILNRALYRFMDFFHHWYIDGSRYLAHGFMTILEACDRTLAVKITLRHFFEPLYGDYTLVGRILGIFFRSGRMLLGLVLYSILGAAFAAIYLVWVSVVPLMILYVLHKLSS